MAQRHMRFRSPSYSAGDETTALSRNLNGAPAQLNVELESMTRGDADGEWLSELITRISRGLETGVYYLLPDFEHNDGSLTKVADEDPTARCLLDLLKFPPAPGDVIWVDDRWLGGYVHRDGALVVDTIDLLYCLRQRGALSSSELFAILRRIRESDLRFVALEQDEIQAVVGDASIVDGCVTEPRVLPW